MKQVYWFKYLTQETFEEKKMHEILFMMSYASCMVYEHRQLIKKLGNQ